MYRRKYTESVRVDRHDLDNRWVVPYNPWLSKKFNAPINVEAYASIKSVKYLYQYVYKGHDAPSIRFENENTLDHDEILYFLDGRYVSAPEAMWRLNEFNLSEKSHTVVRLAVHLSDQQAIVYQDGQEEEADTRQTTLTAWFEQKKNDQDSHNYLYKDIERDQYCTILPEELKGRAILAVINDASIDINNQVLACLLGETVVYEAVDDIISADANDTLTFPVEFLNSLTPTGMPPYKLNLKPGCIIMLLRNLAPTKGLCNWNSLNCNQITAQHYRIKTHWF
ncbi:hypothetical protein AVEN_207727-1 [Araneus ventricosus]|uniref:DNA helicase Pif1-like 2B domain-containing protein n=1 Tax=Araneus ventricosus TaxID=182803 RepID=A0A4Y2V4N4_ARAVE|nr:hypothetical protein AVEN_207727-1 [Araneus ventricosus]